MDMKWIVGETKPDYLLNCKCLANSFPWYLFTLWEYPLLQCSTLLYSLYGQCHLSPALQPPWTKRYFLHNCEWFEHTYTSYLWASCPEHVKGHEEMVPTAHLWCLLQTMALGNLRLFFTPTQKERMRKKRSANLTIKGENEIFSPL